MQINVVKGRDMAILGQGKVARINFKKVFNGTYGASDFIAMTKNFQAIIVEDIYQISMRDSNLARRFILFVSLAGLTSKIDECYNHKVKLYATSEKGLDELFTMDGSKNSEEMFMIHRCISRLKEMQSQKYLQELHQLDPSSNIN